MVGRPILGASLLAMAALAGCGERRPSEGVHSGVATRGSQPPAPLTPAQEASRAEISELAARGGLSPQGLTPFIRCGERVLWGFSVQKEDAVTVWKRYRAAVNATGLYPLLMSDEHSQFAQLHTITTPTPPEQNLALAANIDASEWLAQKARACLEFEGRVRVPDFEVDDSRVQEKDEFQRFALDERTPWFLVLVPTRDPWSVFAYLDYGDWNSYPKAHEHIAIQRYWYDKFGAEPVVVTGDCIEMLVDRPPTSDVECRAIAIEQFAYTAGDLVNQGYGHFGTLARSLKGRKHWFFWWD